MVYFSLITYFIFSMNLSSLITYIIFSMNFSSLITYIIFSMAYSSLITYFIFSMNFSSVITYIFSSMDYLTLVTYILFYGHHVVWYQYFVHIVQYEGRKEMFYLTMHSTHFMYSYMASDIWLRTILIVRKPHRLLFPINSKGSFICTIPQTE